MKNVKPQTKERWVNIRVRQTTSKRLRVDKADMDLKVYDDLINLALDELERTR